MKTTLIIYAFSAILCNVDLYGQSNGRSYKTFRDSTFELGDKILAPTIYHALSGGMHVITEHEDSVKLIGDFLTQHPEIVIELGGYTDARDSEQRNLTLSEHRVRRIKDLLVAKFNIHPERIEVAGYGESDPIVPSERIDQALTPNEKEELHALNRRVEIKILSTSFGRPADGFR